MDQQYSDLVLLIKQTCKCTKQACMYSGNICTLNKQASKVLLIETRKQWRKLKRSKQILLIQTLINKQASSFFYMCYWYKQVLLMETLIKHVCLQAKCMLASKQHELVNWCHVHMLRQSDSKLDEYIMRTFKKIDVATSKAWNNYTCRSTKADEKTILNYWLCCLYTPKMATD